MKFTELNLEPAVLDGLEAMRFEEATPVQEMSIPVILEGKDIIAVAQTGTGKTAAYLLPLLNNFTKGIHEESKVNAIVMAPTRELAQQIDQQLEGFSYFLPVSSVAIYGGNDGVIWEQQKRGLMMGADVVIATPGRLISHANLYKIDFSGVKYFILDEADRMLDMGFYDDIMQIASQLPADKQTIMFSATMPPKIQTLAQNLMHDPTIVKLAVSKPADGIVQAAYVCRENQKIPIIQSLFFESQPERAIIFSSSKLKVKELFKQLIRLKISAGEMHSDLEQAQREQVMRDFKNGKINVLVATDIVSRGIDVEDIGLVINFDVPHDSEDYVHRIGRTARANKEGVALTFISEDDQYKFYQIEKFLEKTIYKMPLPDELGEAPEYCPEKHRNGGRSFGGHGKSSHGNSGSNKGDSNRNKGFNRSANKGEKGSFQGNKKNRPTDSVHHTRNSLPE